MKSLRIQVTAIAVFCFCVGVASGRIVPPHLTWTEEPATTITIAWERDTAGRGTVQYGATTNYAFSVSDSGGYRRHVITLRNLSAGTRYHYKVSSTDGFETEDHMFRTAPGPDGALNFVAYGDNQVGSAPQIAHRGVVEDMLLHDFDFVINSGDMADEQFNPGWAVWEDFFNVTTDLLMEVVYMPTVGNHEDPNDPNSYYWRLFNLPKRPSNSRYYSYDVGNIHFIALHSEDNIEGQTNWLARDLQAAANNTNTAWIFPYFHRPPYTAGNHSPSESVKTNWCPLFVQYEADIVFNGHNHSYERTIPIRGVTYVVTGGGGAALYSVTNDPMHAFTTACYHYVSMQMTGSVMTYSATRSDGLVFDRVVFTNEGRIVHATPAFPKRGESVKITYDAARGPIFYASPVYIYLGADAFSGALVDTMMTYNAGTGLWEYDYVIPAAITSRLAFVFHDAPATNWDNNYTYNWQVLLDHAEFVPSEGAAGSNMTIRYEADMGPLAGSGQIYAHVGYNRWRVSPGADLVMTNTSGNTWECTFRIPAYASRVDVVFHNGSSWDSNYGHDWYARVTGTDQSAPYIPLPVLMEASPVISSNPPVVQNNVGDNVDFDLSGTMLEASDVDSGFGDFGEIYFNYDDTNLYLGGIKADLGGTNNVLVLFLGFDTLNDNAENLWHKSSLPNTLDYLHNIGFTEPMDIAVVFGDEYGDDADYTNFSYGGYDFGQGIYYIGTNNASFGVVANSKLSQFDGSNSIPCVSTDDDGDRQTDRWEAAIPWASLNAPSGVDSVAWILVSGVIGSSSVSGNDRYLSSTYLGHRAYGAFDAYGNRGYNFINLEPLKVLLQQSDYDADGLPNIWEHRNFGSAAGPAASDDDDGDDLDNWGEYVANTEPTNAASTFMGQAAEGSRSEVVLTWPGATNRKYHVYRTLSLTNGFQPYATSLSVNIYTDTVSGVERAFYKFGVELQ